MDIVYYATGTITTLLFAALVILTVVFLIKPRLFNKSRRIKKTVKRRHIAVGAIVIAAVLTLLSGTVLAISEPASMKKARLDQAVTQEQKITTETATKPVVKTEVKTEVVPFDSTSQETSTLKKGATQISVQGVNGERTITYDVSYVNGVETDRKIVKNEITTQPVTQVVQVGTYVAPTTSSDTPKCNPNYDPCVPNVPYDLDCKDIGFKVKVIGTDVYHFDADGDGWGCEAYK